MSREFIITMTAANRQGILPAVTNGMAELGGDLCETSQTVVRGFFTMIFAAEFPDERDPQVVLDHLEGICRPFGISVGLKDPSVENLVAESGERRRYLLTVRGQNGRGILRQIAARLAIDSVDVVGMHAARSDDGDSFEMKMRVALSATLDAAELADGLEELGQSIGFESTLVEFE